MRSGCGSVSSPHDQDESGSKRFTASGAMIRLACVQTRPRLRSRPIGQELCRQDRASQISINISMAYVVKRGFRAVLFVQHMFKNGRHWPVLQRSFVACAKTLGNGSRAAEGGIPKSSRLGVSLPSRSRLKAAVRKREATRWFRWDLGNCPCGALAPTELEPSRRANLEDFK